MTAPTAVDQPVPGAANAPAAISADTAQPSPVAADTTTPSSGITTGTPTSISDGPVDGDSGPDGGSPTSKPSAPPSTLSTRRWRSPRSAMEFAAQANAVATMVLNGDIDLDKARTYSAVARTVAQAMSTEVSRARFVQSEPSLSLDPAVFEDPSDV